MDYIVRATAADGQIRAFAATTRETVETAPSDPTHPCRRTAERHYRNSRFQRKCKRLRRKPGRRDSGQQKRKT